MWYDRRFDVIETADSLITAPSLEPLDLDEVKKQRRFTATGLDTLFDLWISAAREHFESETGVQLMTATWEYWLDQFPGQPLIELPHPPLQSVLQVVYDDVDGVEQVLDPTVYRVIAPQGDLCRRGVVALRPGLTWPVTAGQSKAVRVQYLAGYGSAPGMVPEIIRHALLMLVGHFHRFGEEVQEARGNLLQQLPLGAQPIITARKHAAIQTLPPKRAPDSVSTGVAWV